ncbi:bifunctional histidinol-phosphatase/imidazoleglycerol-phosphate dehydratase HisB [Flammeovirgaceae bacterium]
MKKLLFIDRDGTLIIEPADKQIDSLEKLEFLPGVITWLRKIAERSEYELVMVSNQDGLGTSSFPEETFWPAHTKMIRTLENEGIKFSSEYIDRSFPNENKPTRKPGTAMLAPYFIPEYDLRNSYVIGDRATDMELAINLGCKGLLLNSDLTTQLPQCQSVSSWEDIYEHLVEAPRKAEVIRNTNETQISIRLNLDGKGISKIKTGIGFFDHMLEQIARHAQMDLEIDAKGDLHVDEHHLIEDTGIALGNAFTKALGNKMGLARYGFCLPMDDCLAQVALDFGGRPWIEWAVEFKREKIGEMPTEMFFHFFKSFSDSARCNLNMKAEGENEHHKAEALFKAFAKSILMAKQRDLESAILPTTKGTL